MMLTPGLTHAMRQLRTTQPFNCVATSTVRSFLNTTGLRSELIIKHLHRMGTVRCQLPNGRTLALWSRGDDWISNQVYWRGWNGYEPETVPLFFRLAMHARIMLDVGAYVGFYTLLAAHAASAGLVYAFEPLWSVHERLQRNVTLNGLANVQCIASAVGDIDGIAEFFHVDAQLPSSSSLSFEFMRQAGEVQRTPVSVITLDRFVRDNHLARVDLVKIDTESTEHQVLYGMSETLQRDRPVIVCEVLRGRGSEKLLEEILRHFGYRYYLLTPDGPVLRNRIEGHPEYLNYLFATLGPSDVAQL